MCNTLILLATVFSITGICNAGLAPFITRCKWDDTACALETARKAVPILTAGIPELGVETIDPMHIDIINATTPNAKFIISDITIVGLRNNNITKVQRDAKTSKILLSYVATGTAEANYELNGKLLNMTVSGKGRATLTMTNVTFNYELDIDTTTDENGKKHWHIKDFHHTYETPNESHIMFENLRQGNEILGPAAIKYIESQSNEIVREIGEPLVLTVVAKIVENINQFFKAIPVEELSIE